MHSDVTLNVTLETATARSGSRTISILNLRSIAVVQGLYETLSRLSQSTLYFVENHTVTTMPAHSQNTDVNPLADIDLPPPPVQSEDSEEVATEPEPFDETHIKVAPLRFKE